MPFCFSLFSFSIKIIYNMTLSTLDRRAFLKRLRRPEKQEGREGIFGKTKPLMPFGKSQELPLVPPASTFAVINGGLDPYGGAWGHDQAAHLLRRIGFGLKKEDLDQLVDLSMEEAVDLVLDVDSTPPPHPINDYHFEDPDDPQNSIIDPDVAPGEEWLDAPYNGDLEGVRIESYRGWWFDLMINQGPSIREKLVLFWHHVLSTQSESIFWGKTNYVHNALLRQHVLGNYKEMVKQVTIDPMMLFYLNGFLNHKDAPDENYARELQELFTVGKDNGQGYTEEDVFQAARILTGWRINFDNSTTFFSWQEHDMGDKQFSSYYNNTVINGSADGEAELDALLDMIFTNDDVALFICRKLYRWFVYYNITEEVEQDVIAPLAQIFRDNDYDIKPVIETLLKSEHFFDAANQGCYVKTPVDLVIGTLRSFNLDLTGSNLWNQFVLKYVVGAQMFDMQMLPGDPPNVAGWQAFYQSPQYYRMWINSDTARNRNTYTDLLLFNVLEVGEDPEIDVLGIDNIEFVSQFDNPGDPVQLVEDVTRLLLPQPVSEEKKDHIKSILLSGLPADFYWTTAWSEYLADPSDPMSFEVVNVRLFAMLRHVLRLAEYQLA